MNLFAYYFITTDFVCQDDMERNNNCLNNGVTVKILHRLIYQKMKIRDSIAISGNCLQWLIFA